MLLLSLSFFHYFYIVILLIYFAPRCNFSAFLFCHSYAFVHSPLFCSSLLFFLLLWRFHTFFINFYLAFRYYFSSLLSLWNIFSFFFHGTCIIKSYVLLTLYHNFYSCYSWFLLVTFKKNFYAFFTRIFLSFYVSHSVYLIMSVATKPALHQRLFSFPAQFWCFIFSQTYFYYSLDRITWSLDVTNKYMLLDFIISVILYYYSCSTFVFHAFFLISYNFLTHFLLIIFLLIHQFILFFIP